MMNAIVAWVLSNPVVAEVGFEAARRKSSSKGIGGFGLVGLCCCLVVVAAVVIAVVLMRRRQQRPPTPPTPPQQY